MRLSSALVLALAVACVAYGRHDERFTERLTLTELRDARVLARFEFESERLGAVPRDPVALELDDECVFFVIAFIGTLLISILFSFSCLPL
jgi:hypothetical protein